MFQIIFKLKEDRQILTQELSIKQIKWNLNNLYFKIH